MKRYLGKKCLALLAALALLLGSTGTLRAAPAGDAVGGSGAIPCRQVALIKAKTRFRVMGWTR